MSRAFVKEPEGDAAEALPDRPISRFHNYVTTRGLQQIEAAVVEFQAALAVAAGHDDTLATRKIARELNYWKARRASAELVHPPHDASTVRFGSKVTLDAGGRRLDFRIVGEDEADPRHGLLSYVAPLARELIGKEVGDMVTTPGGEAEVIAIALGDD
jgi:transcription elongation GreA/GreB family factor